MVKATFKVTFLELNRQLDRPLKIGLQLLVTFLFLHPTLVDAQGHAEMPPACNLETIKNSSRDVGITVSVLPEGEFVAKEALWIWRQKEKSQISKFSFTKRESRLICGEAGFSDLQQSLPVIFSQPQKDDKSKVWNFYWMNSEFWGQPSRLTKAEDMLLSISGAQKTWTQIDQRSYLLYMKKKIGESEVEAWIEYDHVK